MRIIVGAIASVLALGSIACAPKDAAVDTTTAASTATPAGVIDSGSGTPQPAYDKLYIAADSTEWSTNPASPAPQTGPIAKGDTVYFNRDPNQMATWQDAKVKKLDAVRFVHPTRFVKP